MVLDPGSWVFGADLWESLKNFVFRILGWGSYGGFGDRKLSSQDFEDGLGVQRARAVEFQERRPRFLGEVPDFVRSELWVEEFRGEVNVESCAD